MSSLDVQALAVAIHPKIQHAKKERLSELEVKNAVGVFVAIMKKYQLLKLSFVADCRLKKINVTCFPEKEENFELICNYLINFSMKNEIASMELDLSEDFKKFLDYDFLDITSENEFYKNKKHTFFSN